MAFQLRISGLADPCPEYPFARSIRRRWKFDFAWPGPKIALEVEGGTHINGRHVRASGYEKDCIKYSWAVILGWKVIRVTGSMVKDGRALILIETALKQQETKSNGSNKLQDLPGNGRAVNRSRKTRRFPNR